HLRHDTDQFILFTPCGWPGPDVVTASGAQYAVPVHSQAVAALVAVHRREPDHGRYRVLGWNRNAHVYVVRHEVTLDDLAFLLPGQRVEDRNCVRLWPKMAFRRRLGTNTT